jgi:hypothetical protein
MMKIVVALLVLQIATARVDIVCVFLIIVMHPLDNIVTDDFSQGTIERVCGLISAKGLTSCLKSLFK